MEIRIKKETVKKETKEEEERNKWLVRGLI